MPALVAQLAEHLHGKEGVTGSIPVEGSSGANGLFGEIINGETEER